MTDSPRPQREPSRFTKPPILGMIGLLVVALLVSWSWKGSGVDAGEFIKGSEYVWERIQRGDLWPPNTEAEYLSLISAKLLETLQIAVIGTLLGVLIALPLGLLASWNHTPHWSLFALARGVTSICRTVPDLVWAIIFVIWVGIGPFAGTLAILVDTVGLCGRFFAEDIEEVDPGPAEALAAIGASRLSVFANAVVPQASPGLAATSLFAFERAVRSSVILGVVGAGGIGAELDTSLSMMEHDRSLTIILIILGFVLVLENITMLIRRRLLGDRR